MARGSRKQTPHRRPDPRAILALAETSSTLQTPGGEKKGTPEERDELEAVDRAMYSGHQAKQIPWDKYAFWFAVVVAVFGVAATSIYQFTDLAANVRGIDGDVKDLKRRSEDAQAKLNDHGTRIHVIERESQAKGQSQRRP
jgi:hypothetical protein